ncbi:outer membrane protein TolC [Inhella inkyongensis]|uniref:Outer membrane protein TolC n=1 Tax=Inhella inkyongensis TaxID=392593 RepID=A0A840RZK6_9BURK|nr:TolC family protein [Inhella inkyongensis]MBB5202983.1 outer membrane protein TolC [Inhella inkyongensis]
MKSHALFRACCLAGLMHAAVAEPTVANPPAPSLAAALDAAWQRAPDFAHTQGQRQRALAEQAVAGRPWAAPPSLELSQRSDRWHRNQGARETELSVGLPLWHWGQRQAQRAAAQGLMALAEAEQAAARLELAGQLREQAWTLLSLQAAWRVAQAQAQGLEALAADVARRVQAGDLAETDRLAARAESLAARTQAAQALQTLSQARQQWRLLTGLAQEPHLSPEPATPAAAIDAHPVLRRAEAQLAQARLQRELEQRSGREASELRLGWRQEQSAWGAEREGALQIGLRIPLEAERRNGVKLVEAETALAVAELTLARLREQLQAEQQLAAEALANAQAQADSSATQAALLRERLALLERAFRAGELALPELLRARASAAEAEAGQLQSDAALGLARARLNQSLGVLP